MASSCNVWYWNISYPPAFLPRLKILQQPFGKIICDHKSELGKTVYKTFHTLQQSPVVAVFSPDEEFENHYDFLPDKHFVSEKVCVNMNGIKQLTKELNSPAQPVPHLFVVVVKACRRIELCGLGIQMCEDSTLILNLLSDSVEDLEKIVYIIDMRDLALHDTTDDVNLHHIRKSLALEIGKIMNDVGKKLISRVFIQGEGGVTGRLSRIFEGQFVALASNKITYVLNSVARTMESFQNLCDKEHSEIILSHLEKYEQLINARLLQLLPDEKNLDKVSQTTASMLAKEMNQAFVCLMNTIISDELCCFSNHEVPLNRIKYKIKERVKHVLKRKLLSSHRPLTFLLSDFTENKAGQSMIRFFETQFCKEWKESIATKTSSLKETISALKKAINEQQNVLEEQIPFEIQLALGRYKEIRSMKITPQALTLKVASNYMNKEKRQSLEDHVKILLREMWQEFKGDLRIVPFRKGTTRLTKLEPGCTICIKKNIQGDLGKGIGCVFGEDSKQRKFVFTCSHVAPPEEKVYTTRKEFIGKSQRRFCIEPSDDITGAFMDFAAIKVSSKSNVILSQSMYHPTGKTSSVRVFSGNYKSLRDKKLFLYKIPEQYPVFVVYEGETYESVESGSSDSENESFAGAFAMEPHQRPLTTGTRFRRSDTIRYLDSHEKIKIQRGDSGSAICYYDVKSEEVVIVFLLIGSNEEDDEEEFLCCRFNECLQCLKFRDPSMRLLRALA